MCKALLSGLCPFLLAAQSTSTKEKDAYSIRREITGISSCPISDSLEGRGVLSRERRVGLGNASTRNFVTEAPSTFPSPPNISTHFRPLSTHPVADFDEAVQGADACQTTRRTVLKPSALERAARKEETNQSGG